MNFSTTNTPEIIGGRALKEEVYISLTAFSVKKFKVLVPLPNYGWVRGI
jgi:hypothetical protein